MLWPYYSIYKYRCSAHTFIWSFSLYLDALSSLLSRRDFVCLRCAYVSCRLTQMGKMHLNENTKFMNERAHSRLTLYVCVLFILPHIEFIRSTFVHFLWIGVYKFCAFDFFLSFYHSLHFVSFYFYFILLHIHNVSPVILTAKSRYKTFESTLWL